MSTTRQYSKGLAIASNYNVPDVGLENVKTSLMFNAPTVYDGLEFAEFKPPSASAVNWPTFDVYTLSIAVQVANASEDMVFSLWQRPSTDLTSGIPSLSLTLPAGTNFVSSDLGVTPVTGMSKNATYFIKCSCADANTFAEGAEFTYLVGRY